MVRGVTMRSAVLVLAAGCLLLSGCPTMPPTWDKIKGVPSSRRLPADLGTGAQITVTRDVGMMADACFTSLRVNGQLVARMDSAERVTLDVAPGTVIIAAGRDPEGKGLCAIGKGHEVAREFRVPDDGRRSFRVGVSSGGLDVYPSP